MGLIAIGRFLANHPLTHDHKLAAWSRFISWQLRSRISSKPKIFNWVNDTRLVVNRGMAGATGNIYAGLHEFADMGFLLHFLRPESFFVDVGANIGSYTVLASGAIGARTASLEPAPATFAYLQRNLDENRLQERVDAKRIAAGSGKGKVSFTTTLDSVNHVANPGEAGTIEVDVDSLDAILGGRRPELIKIDVEGYEAQVLEGAPLTLEDPSLKALLIEVNPGRALDLAERHGFVRHRYDPFTRILVAGGGGGNALMVRDVEFIRKRTQSSPPFKVHGRVV